MKARAAAKRPGEGLYTGVQPRRQWALPINTAGLERADLSRFGSSAKGPTRSAIIARATVLTDC
jgi:hypothetical protein